LALEAPGAQAEWLPSWQRIAGEWKYFSPQAGLPLEETYWEQLCPVEPEAEAEAETALPEAEAEAEAGSSYYALGPSLEVARLPQKAATAEAQRGETGEVVEAEAAAS